MARLLRRFRSLSLPWKVGLAASGIYWSIHLIGLTLSGAFARMSPMIPGLWTFYVGLFTGVCFGAATVAGKRVVDWISRPNLNPGPHAALIGRHGTMGWTDASGLRVRLDGLDWPGRLPPFMPAPLPGSRVRVEAVADGILVVRPDPSA
jgi:membrane protein implicated in regulation of membrane protease activity